MEGEGKKLVTAGTAYQRSQVKSVWCTFRLLLQQRRSVSVSDGLNEGLVSQAAGCRSTRPGVCVYYQSALVSTAGHMDSPPHRLPAAPFSRTQTVTFKGESSDNSPSTQPRTKKLLLHQSTSPLHITYSAHALADTLRAACVQKKTMQSFAYALLIQVLEKKRT